MSLFQGVELESWEPEDFLDDLRNAGFDSALFERGEIGPDRVAVFHPDSANQETLLRIFVEGREVSEGEARAALSQSFTSVLGLGLLTSGDGRVKSNLRLRVRAEGTFADDFSSRLTKSPEDFVMGVASTTRMVRALALPGKRDRILDLCCGGGWLGITLKEENSSVIGSDLNPRALEISRFNARMNGVAGIDWRLGSWYEKVPEKFDLIISNPPFVISPGGQSVALDTEDNETVIPSVLGGIADRLNPGGSFCMLLDWHFMDEEEWSRVPLAGFDHAELQILLFEIKRQTPEEYARHWVGQDPRFGESGAFREEVDRWVCFLKDRGYLGLSSGFLVIRKCLPGEEWLLKESRELAQFNSTTSVDLLGIFEGQSWLKNNQHDFLDLHFKVADGLIQTSQSFLKDGKWEVANLKLTSAGLVAYDGHIDQSLLDIIDAASEGRTIREILPALAAPLGVEPEAISDQVSDLVKELISLGIILPK